MTTCDCQRVRVRGEEYVLPSCVPAKGWTPKGYDNKQHSRYLKFTSRVKGSLPRGKLAHRAVVEALGAVLTPDLHVHHQDNDPRNNCPFNLVIVPLEFNPRTPLRHPYTGVYMSRAEWERTFGFSEVPF